MYDEEKAVISCYKKILEKRRNGESVRFPRGFFGSSSNEYDRAKGIWRANLCLRYAVADALYSRDGLLNGIVHDQSKWQEPVYPLEYFCEAFSKELPGAIKEEIRQIVWKKYIIRASLNTGSSARRTPRDKGGEREKRTYEPDKN